LVRRPVSVHHRVRRLTMLAEDLDVAVRLPMGLGRRENSAVVQRAEIAEDEAAKDEVSKDEVSKDEASGLLLDGAVPHQDAGPTWDRHLNSRKLAGAYMSGIAQDRWRLWQRRRAIATS
jgi:hypothetical protein